MNPNKIVWSEEKAKLKRLPFKEKLRYIWMYFWIPIVATVLAVAFGTFLIVRIATNIPDNWLAVTFANTYADAGTGSQLWKDFTDHTGYDLTQKKVEFNASSYFDYTKNQAKGNAYYNAFVALVDAGELDAITMEPESLAALGQSGRLMDLDDERIASIKAKYGSRFIYYEPTEDDEEHTSPIPVGIDISDSTLVGEYHVYSEGCALGIGAQSENLKEVEDFLDYVLGEG